jgi:hypothetical protein
MNQAKGLLLSTLIRKSHGKLEESIANKLPPESAKNVLNYQNLDVLDPLPILRQKQDFIEFCHYSWLEQDLRPLAGPERAVCLACLPEEKKMKLASIFQMQPPPSPAPLGNRFAMKKLLQAIPAMDLLPIDYLNESDAKQLLSLNKGQLVQIIDFLGLYDLSHEVRRMVATVKLKNVYKSLSSQFQQFLRLALHQKDRVIALPFSREKWNGSAQDLFRYIHRAGLRRLGIALSGQAKDVIEYFAYKLDTGRGAILKKLVYPKEIPIQTGAALQQIEGIKTFLFKENLK